MLSSPSPAMPSLPFPKPPPATHGAAETAKIEPDQLAYLTGHNSDYILQGLPLPNTLDPGSAAHIALVYASETRNILYAEACIAESRYRQQLMAAQSLRLHMLKTQSRKQQAVADVATFKGVTDGVIASTTCDPELLELCRTMEHLHYGAEPSSYRYFHDDKLETTKD